MVPSGTSRSVTVRFIQRGNPGALVFRVEPTTAYAFGKAPYSQTRWRF